MAVAGWRRTAAKGANVAYKLAVPFTDAATLATQRVTLADGRSLDLKLPPGVETGTQMRLAGRGDEGPGGAGDAIVTIEVQPHRFFTRDGDDVRVDLPVTLAEAVLGGQVRAPTVDKPVMLTVPKGTIYIWAPIPEGVSIAGPYSMQPSSARTSGTSLRNSSRKAPRRPG